MVGDETGSSWEYPGEHPGGYPESLSEGKLVFSKFG